MKPGDTIPLTRDSAAGRAVLERRPSTSPTSRRPRPSTRQPSLGPPKRLPGAARGAPRERRAGTRRDRHSPIGGAPFTADADRRPRELRRPGGHRHRARAAVPGGHRGARARAGDGRHPPGHRELADDGRAGLRRHPRQCAFALRIPGGNLFLFDGEAFRLVAHRGMPTTLAEAWQRPSAGPHTGLARAVTERQPVQIADMRPTPPTGTRPDAGAGGESWAAAPSLRAAAQERGADRRPRDLAPAGPAVQREPGPAPVHLRRPGGDRPRERPPVPGARGPQPRADRGPRAADGDQRGPENHQPLDLRPPAGPRHARRERGEAVRCADGCHLPAPRTNLRMAARYGGSSGVQGFLAAIRRSAPGAGVRWAVPRSNAESCGYSRCLGRTPSTGCSSINACGDFRTVLGVPMLREETWFAFSSLRNRASTPSPTDRSS